MIGDPRLRTVNKVVPPYELNAFPREFVKRFTEEVIYLHATKDPVSIEGDEWEQIFAHCVGAKWAPSNVGLDDVRLKNCCWSAKTVKSNAKDLGKIKDVRLISGRCSPVYSYGEELIGRDADPNLLGAMVLGIWNERVSAVREIFKFMRTVVLVKGRNHEEFLIFETDTVRYEPDRFEFGWNKGGNIEGYEKETGKHRFTWQPHGSQFTIKEEVPKERLHLRINAPKRIDKLKVLKAVGYEGGNLGYWVIEMP